MKPAHPDAYDVEPRHEASDLLPGATGIDTPPSQLDAEPTLTGLRTPVSLELRLAAEDFLTAEAELLDSQKFHIWLELLTEDVHYTVPIRVTRKRGNPNVIEDMFHYEEDMRSLTLRVRRLDTDVAWAEDPPSHTRRFVTNVRVSVGARDNELAVRSYLLLYRSRGDLGTHDLISGERHDILRYGDMWRLASRKVILDQSTLGTKNLGVFL